MKKIIPFILAAAVSLPGHAQPDYPPPQIRFIVPFSPGGGTDVIMRLVAHHLGEAWKIAVLVENRVGAAGVIGSHYVVTQPPDGRTFLAVASAFGVRSAIDRSVPYDVARDFTGVAQMARSPSFMVVSPERGFKSLKDLVAYARAQPLGVYYASAGACRTTWRAISPASRRWRARRA